MIEIDVEHHAVLGSRAHLRRAQDLHGLLVRDLLEKPVADAAGTLRVNGADQDVTTDGDGHIEATIDNGATSATLTLGPQTYTLAVGHLDPIDEASGQLARLKALGYFDGDVPEAADFEKQKIAIGVETQLAWELFQDVNGLQATGAGDDDSVSKLKEVFGA